MRAAVMSPEGAMVNLDDHLALQRRVVAQRTRVHGIDRALVAGEYQRDLIGAARGLAAAAGARRRPGARWPSVGSLTCVGANAVQRARAGCRARCCVGALMPPLVPPALEVISDRVTSLTSPGSVVFG